MYLGIVSQSRNSMYHDDDFAPNNHEFQPCFRLPKIMFSIAKIHILSMMINGNFFNILHKECHFTVNYECSRGFYFSRNFAYVKFRENKTFT